MHPCPGSRRGILHHTAFAPGTHRLPFRRGRRPRRPVSAAPPRCHCEEYPKGTCFAARSDAAIRFPFRKDGFPRQPADWLGMTGSRGGRLCPPEQREALQGPLWEGAVGAADWGGEQVPCDISPFGGASLRFFSDIHKLRLHFLCK